MDSDRAEHEHHICEISIYLRIFGALMVLTILTVGVAFMNLGPLNNVVALGIAVVKAFLVITVFMHLKFNARILWIVACGGFIWLAVMVAFTLSDLMTRSWFPGIPETWL